MKFKLQLGSRNFGFELFGKQPVQRRGYDAATVSRLNSDWLMPQTSADAEITSSLATLRGRARELERNNEIVQRYLSLLENNVLGANGVGLQMKISDPQGTLDTMANDIVKKGWEQWTTRKYCTPSGHHCWREVESMALRRTACDGGLLVRLLRGWDNPYGFAVQPLEIDHLDLNYNVTMQGGGEIRFGIEMDKWKRPVAFHMFAGHPGDNASPRKRERILAADVLHLFWSERPSQSTGVPWIACVMQELEHLGKYKEAELVAARLEAAKGFCIKPATPEGYTGPKDDAGNNIQEMQPGMGFYLQPGEEYIPINPTHPNTAFGEFVKSSLRGIAGGMSVNYSSLANDLSDTNYSSMRAGKLEEIEEYKGIQSWLIESLHVPVFAAWLESSLIHGALKAGNGSALPVGKLDKFNAPDWKPRRWPWVDPLKDLQASVLAVEKGFKSRREIIAEMGGDVENVFLELAEDEKLSDEYDLEFPIGSNPQQPQADVEDVPPKKAAGLTPAQE